MRELVLLLARRSEGDPNFGGLKLNKLLFYSDFLAYLTLGEPITGAEYFALPNGPAPRHKVGLWEKWKNAGDIAVRRQSSGFDSDREVTLALREPDLSRFKPEEVDLAYKVLRFCRKFTGNDLSFITHMFPGWKLRREKETIPYSIALVSSRKPSGEEVKRGLELEASLGTAV